MRQLGVYSQQQLEGQPGLTGAGAAHQEPGGDRLRRFHPGKQRPEVGITPCQVHRAVFGLEEFQLVGGRIGQSERMNRQPSQEVVQLVLKVLEVVVELGERRLGLNVAARQLGTQDGEGTEDLAVLFKQFPLAPYQAVQQALGRAEHVIDLAQTRV